MGLLPPPRHVLNKVLDRLDKLGVQSEDTRRLDRTIPKYILWYMANNSKTLLTVKTDKQLKRAAQAVAGELGGSLGTLVNSYLKQVVRTKEITLSASLRPTRALEASIAAAEAELASGKLAQPTANIAALARSLRA